MNKRFRMIEWLLVTVALLALIAWVSPQQLPVALYKLALVTSAGWLAYWISVSLMPYARPDKFLDTDGELIPVYEIPFAAALLARAIVVGAAMIAVSVGL